MSENGLPLGTLSSGTYSAVEVAVKPGDKALLYTDGIPETASPSEQEFGADLLKGFLESNHNPRAAVFSDSLLHELSGWSEHQQGEGHQDDITLLAINFRTSEIEEEERTLREGTGQTHG